MQSVYPALLLLLAVLRIKLKTLCMPGICSNRLCIRKMLCVWRIAHVSATFLLFPHCLHFRFNFYPLSRPQKSRQTSALYSSMPFEALCPYSHLSVFNFKRSCDNRTKFHNKIENNCSWHIVYLYLPSSYSEHETQT